MTTTYYPNTRLTQETKDAAQKRLSWVAYDLLGRQIFAKDAMNYTTRTAYTLRGEVAQTWGSGTYPVSYEHNDFGERVKMRTYRDPADGAIADSSSFPSAGTADETSWEFDPASGVLRKKYDAKVRFVEYTYNSTGRLYQRLWARTLPNSSTRVTTTYAYDGATGEQTAVTYNDGTPGLAYAYNRLGQNTSVVQSYSGSTIQTLLDYCLCGKVTMEYFDSVFFGARNLSHVLNSNADGFKGRTTGYVLSTGATVEQAASYGYESATGRFSSLSTQAGGGQAAFTHTFTYAYLASSNLISALSVDAGHPFTITRSFEPNRDLITAIETKWSTVSRAKYAYTYDDRRQRANVVQSGNVFADYGGPSNGAIHQNFAYNGRGELVQAASWLGDLAAGEPPENFMSARKHEFAYDGIGNRRWSNAGGVTGTRDHYAVDELNQYVARENNTLPVGGTVANDAGIKVVAGANAVAPAGRHGRHWGDNMLLDNLAGPFLGPINVYAGKAGGGAGGADLLKVVQRTAFLPPAWQMMVYDADGNILSDGVWTYTWDAENRLIGMETMAEAIPAFGNANARRLELKYDHLGRRIEKLVRSGWNGSSYTSIASQRRFLYNGWNLMAEYTVAGGALNMVRSYTWGLDIVHSLAESGGVGALLQIADHTSGQAYFPSYDGNGNITALFNGNGSSGGTCVAAYEYSPYGEFLRCEGTYAKENPFRFSTKFTDDETGLVYYGRRYYSPGQGRFLGRDPKGEKGGMNLYAFVRNNPTNAWDYLGMTEQMGAFVVNGGRREEWQEEDEAGCLWEVTAQDMSSDTAYGFEDMHVVQRVKISCRRNSDPDDGDGPNNPDLSKLPGCSELKKGLADGTYKPKLTSESFIPQKEVSLPGTFGFEKAHGDGREFLDSPSDGTPGRTSRISASVGYSGDSFFVTPSFRIDQSTHTRWWGLTSVTATGVPSSMSGYSVNIGDGVSLGLAYSGSNPLAPYVVNPGTGNPNNIRMQAAVSVDFSTGMLTGTYSRSMFPAAQLFFDGRPIANLPASGMGPAALMAINEQGQVNGVPVCDPSR